MSPRKRLPTRREGIRFTVAGAHVSTGEYPDGRLGEIFISYQKEGSFAKDILNAWAISVSLCLQHGISLDTLRHTYREFRMEPDLILGIFAELEARYSPKKEDACV